MLIVKRHLWRKSENINQKMEDEYVILVKEKAEWVAQSISQSIPTEFYISETNIL